MSLRRRLFFSIFIITVLGFFLLTRWVRGELLTSYSQLMEEALVDQANLLASFVEKNGFQPQTFELLQQSLNHYASKKFPAQIYEFKKIAPSLHLYITDSKGIVIFADDASLVGKDYSQWNDVAKTLRGEYGARSTRMDPNNSRSSVYYVAAPLREGDQIFGSLTVYKAEDSVVLMIDRALQKLFYGGIFASVVVVLFGALILLWVTYPLERLRQYAVSLSEGNKEILPQSNIREVRQLGEAFEKMRISLEGKKTIERYIQILTHEMKSPLTAIQGAAELSLEAMDEKTREHFLNNIIYEARRSHRLLEQLLKISALESKTLLSEVQTVQVSKIVDDVKASLLGVWQPRSIEVRLNVTEDLQIECDPFLTAQALKNVVLNAIEFSHDGGVVTVQAHHREESIVIQVEDEGSGIPDFARDKIFEKFYSLERPNNNQKSTGLGLSFVKEVINLHRGQISFQSEKNSSGRMKTCFEMVFPIRYLV